MPAGEIKASCRFRSDSNYTVPTSFLSGSWLVSGIWQVFIVRKLECVRGLSFVGVVE